LDNNIITVASIEY